MLNKLDSYRIRFADEDDKDDITVLINRSHAVDYTANSLYAFRKDDTVTLSAHQVETECLSDAVQWVVLESPDEDIVIACARFQIQEASINSKRKGVVDIIGTVGVGDLTGILPPPGESSEISLAKVLHIELIRRLEDITRDLGCEVIDIQIPQWRTDLCDVVEAIGYKNCNGFMWPDDSANTLLKPTMVLGFQKTVVPPLPQPNRAFESPISLPISRNFNEWTATDITGSEPEPAFESDGSAVVLNADNAAFLGITYTDTDKSLQPEHGEQQGEVMEELIDKLFAALHAEMK